MGNLMLTAKFAYTDGGFVLDPRGSDLDENNINAGAEWQYFYSPLYYGGSLYHYITNRNTLNLSVNGNYFAEGVIGGDHEIRFGVDYYNGTTTTQTMYPNQRIAFYYPSSPTGAWLIPNPFYNADFNRMSLYISDTATFGKLTVNLGVRYDHESGTLNEQLQQGFTWYEPGSPHHGEKMFNNVLGDLLVQGGDSPQEYKVISPRLSLTYDIGGDGKNVVKMSVARYGGQSGNALTNRFWPYRETDVWWKGDFNNDDMINYDEIADYYYWWNTDKIDYSKGWNKHQTDPDFNSPLLDELTVSFEKAFGTDLAVGITGFYKKNHNLVRYIALFEDGTQESAANFYEGTYTFDDGSTVPLYNRYARPASFGYYTNYDGDTNYEYMALQFIFSKKFSDKWMLDASFTYADWKANYAKADYNNGDLTNYEYFNGAVRAPAVSGSSGLSGIYVNARWQFKLSGLYQLPWGINVTGVFQAREGYVLPFHESVYRGNGLGWTNMYPAGEKFGDNRLPTFWMLSLGLEKTFKVSDTVTTTFFVDGYNVTNNNTTLLVETSLTASNYNEPLRILNPGIFQFGIRVNF